VRKNLATERSPIRQQPINIKLITIGHTPGSSLTGSQKAELRRAVRCSSLILAHNQLPHLVLRRCTGEDLLLHSCRMLSPERRHQSLFRPQLSLQFSHL